MAHEQNTKGMSPEAIEELKRVEGFSSEPYADGKHGRSIGYGIHESAHPDIFSKYGSSITKEQGHEQLIEVIKRQERDLKSRFGADTWDRMNQGQRDVIESVAYNAGPRRVAEAIGSELKDGNYEQAADKLERIAPSGITRGKKVDLTGRRRKAAEDFRQSSN